MFMTLVGTDRDTTAHVGLFDSLRALAVAKGFVPGDTALPIRTESGLSPAGWTVEQVGPSAGDADFLLAVTAPRSPGVSPILPFAIPPFTRLFAVVVLKPSYCVWSAGAVSGAETLEEAATAFSSFLQKLSRTRDAGVRGGRPT